MLKNADICSVKIVNKIPYFLSTSPKIKMHGDIYKHITKNTPRFF